MVDTDMNIFFNFKDITGKQMKYSNFLLTKRCTFLRVTFTTELHLEFQNKLGSIVVYILLECVIEITYSMQILLHQCTFCPLIFIDTGGSVTLSLMWIFSV